MRFSLISFQDDFILFTSSYMVIQVIQVVPLLFRPNSLQSFLLLGRAHLSTRGEVKVELKRRGCNDGCPVWLFAESMKHQ